MLIVMQLLQSQLSLDSEQKPETPTITATNADCDSATGTITVGNYDSNLNYVLVSNDNDTEYSINNDGVFTEVAPGTYSVRAENADCNATSATATIQDSEQKPDYANDHCDECRL